MSSFFVSLSLMFAAFTANTTLAACPGSTMKIHDVRLNSDGVITRMVTVKKHSDAQNSEKNEKYVAVVRDVMKLEIGDEIVLNAGLQMVDASVTVKLKLREQMRDEKGVFSTTYEVIETMVSSFAGVESTSQKAYLAKVISNYAGNGTYTKGCGEVIQTEMNTEEPLPQSLTRKYYY